MKKRTALVNCTVAWGIIRGAYVARPRRGVAPAASALNCPAPIGSVAVSGRRRGGEAALRMGGEGRGRGRGERGEADGKLPPRRGSEASFGGIRRRGQGRVVRLPLPPPAGDATSQSRSGGTAVPPGKPRARPVDPLRDVMKTK